MRIARAGITSLHHFLNAASCKAIQSDKWSVIENREDDIEAREKRFFDIVEQSEYEPSADNPRRAFTQANCDRNRQAFIPYTARQPEKMLSIFPDAIRSGE